MKTIVGRLALFGLILLVLTLIVTQPLVGPVAIELSTNISAAELRKHVFQLSEMLPSRDTNPDHLAASAEYIFTQFASSGQPEYQEFTVRGMTYRNVSLRLGHGDGPLLIVGAHYDAAGGLPGADDNASGVAGLLELARALSRAELDSPVELVAYALEESPVHGSVDMGSHWHAKRLRAGDQDVGLMIALEMIGYFSDDSGSQTFPFPGMGAVYPNTGNFIAIVGRLREIIIVRHIKRLFRSASDVPIYSLTAPPLIPGMTLSDHRNYWQHGYKAVMVTDTAYLRNPNYHQPTDTVDTLDYERMAKVIAGLHAVIVGFSQQ